MVGSMSKYRPAVPANSKTIDKTILALPRLLVTAVRWIPSTVTSKVHARNIAIGKPTTKRMTVSVATHCGRNS